MPTARHPPGGDITKDASGRPIGLLNERAQGLVIGDNATVSNVFHTYFDSAYASQKALIHSKAPDAKDFTNKRTRKSGVINEIERSKNRNKSKIRSRVEHVFGVVKRLWGFSKVRYRGLARNATRAFTALALANIYLSRQHLMAQVRP